MVDETRDDTAAPLTEPAPKRPSIGRTVHVVEADGTHRPGTVIETDGESVCVIGYWGRTERGNFGILSDCLPYNPEPLPGTWHWPEFV